MASTIVVMKGLAITAGSKPIFFASSGSVQPTNFAQNTVTTRVRHMVSATINSRPSKSMSFAKLHTASVIPHTSATLNSFHMTLKMSLNSISPRDMARIMVTDACPPELPPVSMSIGI